MSFRQKNKQSGADKRNWNSFCEVNWLLIERIGLPITTVETLDLFYDLLMHGYIDHHDDPLHFSIDQLDPERLDLFRVLIEKYFEAGFHDPGMGAWLVGGEEPWLALVRRYPNQFTHYDVKHAKGADEESALKAQEAWKTQEEEGGR
jgi:hypothetical protein